MKRPVTNNLVTGLLVFNGTKVAIVPYRLSAGACGA